MRIAMIWQRSFYSMKYIYVISNFQSRGIIHLEAHTLPHAMDHRFWIFHIFFEIFVLFWNDFSRRIPWELLIVNGDNTESLRESYGFASSSMRTHPNGSSKFNSPIFIRLVSSFVGTPLYGKWGDPSNDKINEPNQWYGFTGEDECHVCLHLFLVSSRKKMNGQSREILNWLRLRIIVFRFALLSLFKSITWSSFFSASCYHLNHPKNHTEIQCIWYVFQHTIHIWVRQVVWDRSLCIKRYSFVCCKASGCIWFRRTLHFFFYSLCVCSVSYSNSIFITFSSDSHALHNFKSSQIKKSAVLVICDVTMYVFDNVV